MWERINKFTHSHTVLSVCILCIINFWITHISNIVGVVRYAEQMSVIIKKS